MFNRQATNKQKGIIDGSRISLIEKCEESQALLDVVIFSLDPLNPTPIEENTKKGLMAIMIMLKEHYADVAVCIEYSDLGKPLDKQLKVVQE